MRTMIGCVVGLYKWDDRTFLKGVLFGFTVAMFLGVTVVLTFEVVYEKDAVKAPIFAIISATFLSAAFIQHGPKKVLVMLRDKDGKDIVAFYANNVKWSGLLRHWISALAVLASWVAGSFWLSGSVEPVPVYLQIGVVVSLLVTYAGLLMGLSSKHHNGDGNVQSVGESDPE